MADVPRDVSLEPETLWVWMLDDGTRCALAASGEFVWEVRIVNDDVVLRRARYADVKAALDAARAWRCDWDAKRGEQWDVGPATARAKRA